MFAPHPVKRVWRASLCVWNHYSEGSWHVQVDYLREARHQVSVSGCQISGLLSCSSGSLPAWAWDCFVRPLRVSSLTLPPHRLAQMESSCMTNVIRRIMHYTALTYQSKRPAESVTATPHTSTPSIPLQLHPFAKV